MRIVSDSDYSIKCITVWSNNWARNGWKNAKGKPVANQDIIKPILNMRAFFGGVAFTHINSHTGKTDPLSLGNEAADALACAGAKMQRGVDAGVLSAKRKISRRAL